LLLAAHHLVVDGLSWRVAIEDLATACEQRQSGEEIRLPAKTTSVVEWAARLREEAAGGDELRAELDYWAAQSRRRLALPRDRDVSAEANTHATTRLAWRRLGEEQTRSLLQDVTQAFGTEMNDVLVTGLLRAMQPWTGRRDQVLFMDGHGREPILDGVDLSRTMGWFTSMYPMHLELPSGWAPERSVVAVAEQLGQAPRRGVGYLVLKFLEEPEVSQVLHATPEPEATFNYLGQLDQTLASSSLFGWSSAPVGPRRSPLGRRPALLDFFGEVRAGSLRVACSYSAAIHEEQTIAALLDRWVEALGELVMSASESVGGVATAKAVSRGDLDRQDLDRLLEELD
jgi:non-ribosomal peptide synthase protein (TIGR01720 family)